LINKICYTIRIIPL